MAHEESINLPTFATSTKHSIWLRIAAYHKVHCARGGQSGKVAYLRGMWHSQLRLPGGKVAKAYKKDTELMIIATQYYFAHTFKSLKGFKSVIKESKNMHIAIAFDDNTALRQTLTQNCARVSFDDEVAFSERVSYLEEQVKILSLLKEKDRKIAELEKRVAEQDRRTGLEQKTDSTLFAHIQILEGRVLELESKFVRFHESLTVKSNETSCAQTKARDLENTVVIREHEIRKLTKTITQKDEENKRLSETLIEKSAGMSAAEDDADELARIIRFLMDEIAWEDNESTSGNIKEIAHHVLAHVRSLRERIYDLEKSLAYEREGVQAYESEQYTSREEKYSTARQDGLNNLHFTYICPSRASSPIIPDSDSNSTISVNSGFSPSTRY